MSFLRFLSPIRGSSKRKEDDLTMTLRVPAYGDIFMTPPDDPLWPLAISPDLPRLDQLLHGELDIHVPEGSPRRCKAIRVGMRTKARLLMGPARGWEEDIIFERKCEVIGGSSEGLLLVPGTQRFDFTLILPASLAPHDHHVNGKVTHQLFAELDGVPLTSPLSFAFRSRGSPGSFSSFRSDGAPRTPPSGSPRSRCPSPPSPLGSPALAPVSLNVTRQEGIPRAPTYDESEEHEKVDDWIKGRFTASRDLSVLYNPHRHGGVCDLDERQSGFADGIGVYDLKLFSDVFSIGGPIHARLTLPDLSPKATIFHWRLSLAQTHKIKSPRDPDSVAPISTTNSFTMVEHGHKPPKGVLSPGADIPCMWRGLDAGGSDTGSFKIEGHGMMPRDDRGRPTTLPGVETPINVSHTLVYEIFFSIWGEGHKGEPVSGPGALRFMRVERPIIVPSCCLIPQTLDLPIYSFICHAMPCPLCGLRRDEQLCVSCPPTLLPHPRHDLPERIVGNTDGICPHCSKSQLPEDDSGVCPGICACGGDIKSLEDRMKRFILEGVETDYTRELVERNTMEKRAAEVARPSY